MSRKRHRPELPKYCREANGWIRCTPYLGPGKKRPTITLCRADAPMSEIWLAYEEKVKGDVKHTVSWMIARYLLSPEAQSLKSYTQIQQRLRYFSEFTTQDGDSLGEYPLHTITPGLLRAYLDRMRDDEKPVMGNRIVETLGVAWKWAFERDMVPHESPTKHVRRNKEKPRDRLVTDIEFQRAVKLAKAQAPTHVWIAMELARLCGMRKAEVCNATRDQITEEGFLVVRTKGSKNTVVAWSPRLRAAIDATEALRPEIRQIRAESLLHNTQGKPLTVYGFQANWTKFMNNVWLANGGEYFRFHDLKAAAVSNSDQREFGGHKSEAKRQIYERKPRLVNPSKIEGK